jgi:hypothetical protein
METLDDKIEHYQKMYETHDKAYIYSNKVQNLKESYYYKGRRDECIDNKENNTNLLTREEKDLMISVLNFFWDDAVINLRRINIGDYEKIAYESRKNRAEKLIDKLKK